ncbi:D-alanine--D-alanine ligase [Pusillimonas noertemannii]|uniref:D-alanine--D-alanine ligase n=1 Tax=Pusillimonas noertemannii TaxID=305977 RepID=A0A2U1CKK7_9BURK|nr:D-alanine--D-alanine ligase [Pusillimonas noertemannii]NYT69064.1 D-alanine--D-alanine ligase [Pusillimonas noertemannii]PVY61531.1 D-alanine--D-alanine ligase [Pusillimonas noertemannii]TFL09481.1 D-alanine--D-alanine ligase [Pusillimonas noertemannii]
MSNRFGHVGVLYGGQSAEREVSLMSGRGVHEALRRAGVDAHLFDTGTRTLTDLVNAGFDRVFIALHGRYGEDGTLQGMLELMKLPYTGSGPLASSLSMDKVMTKKVWLHEGLPTPDYVVLTDENGLDEAVDRLGLPLIMKPPHEGSTMGVTKVTERAQMKQAYRLAARFDAAVLAEQFIEGRELTVPLLGGPSGARGLPIVEIVAPGGNYDYEHKYLSDETQYICPAQLDAGLADRIRQLAERSYEVLGCEGWGRADFMLDARGRPWLLEMNTSPGMTSHSLVPMGAKAAGMSYEDLCLAILETASCKVAAPGVESMQGGAQS